MKVKEVRDMKTEELHGELDRLRRHVFDLRTQSVTEELKNPSLLTEAKHDIARLLMVLGERGEVQVEQKQHHLEAQAAHKQQKKR